MSKVTKFDRPTLAVLRTDIEAALAEVAKKHGITLGIGGMTFTQTTFTTRISAVAAAEDASNSDDAAPNESNSDVNPKWIVAFNRNAFLHGFNRSDLNRTFKIGRIEHTLVGWRTKATYKAVVRKNGRLVCMDHTTVLNALRATR